MPEENADKSWDEYDWERFLQEQERRTEKYMGLLEKYMDDPDRDAIIAREMGWTHLIGGETREWEDEVESSFEDAVTDEPEPVSSEPLAFAFEKHPLYRETIAFSAELDELFVRVDESVREHPAAVALRDDGRPEARPHARVEAHLQPRARQLEGGLGPSLRQRAQPARERGGRGRRRRRRRRRRRGRRRRRAWGRGGGGGGGGGRG